MRVVLMGPPGVGKGTQAARLSEALGVVHVSTGDMLRHAVGGGSALGRKVREFVEGGKLVPDDLMGDLIEERLEKSDASRGFILDGFPRTVEQIAILDRALRHLDVTLDHVFILSAPEDEIVRRLSGRRVCPGCKAVYHLESKPPKSAGVCDACGSALIQRADDGEDVIRERLDVYADLTAPVAAAYGERGVLVELDGHGDPDAVAARLHEAIATEGGQRVSQTVLKSAAEIGIMDEANRIIRTILDDLGERVRPGVTTGDLDAFAESRILEAGGVPAFKGYPHRGDGHDFPGTICASINDEIVHGVPSQQTRLNDGDVISVDLGIRLNGYFGDSARTFAVGTISEEAGRLLNVTRESLRLGVEQVAPGNRVSDIGYAVQTYVEHQGFSVVREFVGHGIGANLHEDPQIPNFGAPGRGLRLTPGMVLAIEPMVNAGGPDVVLSADDGWTARTKDGSLSAHFEVSVAVTEDGHKILGGPLVS